MDFSFCAKTVFAYNSSYSFMAWHSHTLAETHTHKCATLLARPQYPPPTLLTHWRNPGTKNINEFSPRENFAKNRRAKKQIKIANDLWQFLLLLLPLVLRFCFGLLCSLVPFCVWCVPPSFLHPANFLCIRQHDLRANISSCASLNF